MPTSDLEAELTARNGEISNLRHNVATLKADLERMSRSLEDAARQKKAREEELLAESARQMQGLKSQLEFKEKEVQDLHDAKRKLEMAQKVTGPSSVKQPVAKHTPAVKSGGGANGPPLKMRRTSTVPLSDGFESKDPFMPILAEPTTPTHHVPTSATTAAAAPHAPQTPIPPQTVPPSPAPVQPQATPLSQWRRKAIMSFRHMDSSQSVMRALVGQTHASLLPSQQAGSSSALETVVGSLGLGGEFRLGLLRFMEDPSDQGISLLQAIDNVLRGAGPVTSSLVLLHTLAQQCAHVRSTLCGACVGASPSFIAQCVAGASRLMGPAVGTETETALFPGKGDVRVRLPSVLVDLSLLQLSTRASSSGVAQSILRALIEIIAGRKGQKEDLDHVFAILEILSLHCSGAQMHVFADMFADGSVVAGLHRFLVHVKHDPRRALVVLRFLACIVKLPAVIKFLRSHKSPCLIEAIVSFIPSTLAAEQWREAQDVRILVVKVLYSLHMSGMGSATCLHSDTCCKMLISQLFDAIQVELSHMQGIDGDKMPAKEHAGFVVIQQGVSMLVSFPWDDAAAHLHRVDLGERGKRVLVTAELHRFFCRFQTDSDLEVLLEEVDELKNIFVDQGHYA